MKIVLIGPYNSGKSTIVQKICRGSAISIDYGGTTVAMDHCKTRVYGIDVFLFGTPGLQRFEILRKILSKGADGVLFIVDSVNTASFIEAKGMVEEIKHILPGKAIVLCANKQDIMGAKKPEEVSNTILSNEDSEVSVIGTSAKTGEGLDQALGLIVLNAIKEYYPILIAVKNSDSSLSEIAKKLDLQEDEVSARLQYASWRRLINADWDKNRFSLTKGTANIIEILEFGSKKID